MPKTQPVAVVLWLILVLPYLLLAILPLLTAKFETCPKYPPEIAKALTPAVKMPDLSRLAAMAGSGGFTALTDEQLLEEREIQAEQIQQAKVWLEDADPGQRTIGAEQLSAYPSATSEQLLVSALTRDDTATVRSAAAESLAFFKTLKQSTILALIEAMHDMDEEVRFSAFNSLQTLVNRPETDKKTTKLIFSKLKQLQKSGWVDSDTKTAIQDFLQDRDAL